MLEAILWGLVQGITEFLPVSSSGHLRVIPDLLGMEPPDLSTSAVLHIGTLVAVMAYYRRDIAWMLGGLGRDRTATSMVVKLAVATVPAALVGFTLASAVDRFQDSAPAVGVALMVTGLVLLFGGSGSVKRAAAEDLSLQDALIIGMVQAVALLPGISRSGVVITAANRRGISPQESGRFGFLMAIPAIAGAGLGEFMDMGSGADLSLELVVGTVVAGVAGFWAIKFLIDRLARSGLRPFGFYCIGIGLVTMFFL